ncbi:hypothetical protein C8R43DRAFT_871273 [Mycena crocata]|nr:hypothetical protein C8R43DRAFT_871273 [Mycena crocata]
MQNYKNATQVSDQGIADGKPVGQEPQAAGVTIDTFIDRDASGQNSRTDGPFDELPGATSKDVSESAGKPGTGMSSKELRHNGQQGRKREKLGDDRFGTSSKDVEQ